MVRQAHHVHYFKFSIDLNGHENIKNSTASGKHKEAIADYKKAMKLDPTHKEEYKKKIEEVKAAIAKH